MVARAPLVWQYAAVTSLVDETSSAKTIVLDVPDSLCLQRNEQRPNRDFGPHVVRRQRQDLRRSLRTPGCRPEPPSSRAWSSSRTTRSKSRC